jgi:hypothetical protein
MLVWSGHRGTFIPQMWTLLPDAESFMAELKRKAGLARDFWAPDVELWRYGATSAIDRPAEA